MLKPLIIALKPLIVALGAARAGAQRMSTALRGILNAAKQAARRGLERLRDRWRGYSDEDIKSLWSKFGDDGRPGGWLTPAEERALKDFQRRWRQIA